MIQDHKSIGVLAMITLVSVSLSANYVGLAFASDDTNPNPHVSIQSVLFANQGWYRVNLTVFSGDSVLRGGTVVITSDVHDTTIDFDDISKNSFKTLDTVVKASSSDAVSAKLINLKQVENPSVGVVSVTPVLEGGVNEFYAVLSVKAGDSNMSKVKLSVSSDLQSMTVNAAGNNGNTAGGIISAGTSAVTSIKILASDPNSISAKIADYAKV